MADINNLFARIEYKSGSNLPVCLLLPTWLSDATQFYDVMLERLASHGLFVASIGKRGSNGADGTADASGREIYDIYDALTYLRNTYPNIVSPTIAAVVGYSGGGGNALAAASKFPDAWNVVVDYFGMSDYGRDGINGWYQNNGAGAYTAGIVSSVGDTPTNTPNNYYARDATSAITNFSEGFLYLYHDKQDPEVPWVHSTRIKTAMDNANLTNYSTSFTDTGDSARWTHAIPRTNSDLILTEPTWITKIKSQAAWTISTTGTITVIGYIVTKRFTIWLNTNGTATQGIDGVATVVYNTTTDTYTVTPLTTGGLDVSITQGAKTGSATNISSETEIVVA